MLEARERLPLYEQRLALTKFAAAIGVALITRNGSGNPLSRVKLND
jgi:hypothetical protein